MKTTCLWREYWESSGVLNQINSSLRSTLKIEHTLGEACFPSSVPSLIRWAFLAPVVLPAKIILQDLCRQKYSWDEDLPDNVIKNWKSWIPGLQQLENFGVDRCIKTFQSSHSYIPFLRLAKTPMELQAIYCCALQLVKPNPP